MTCDGIEDRDWRAVQSLALRIANRTTGRALRLDRTLRTEMLHLVDTLCEKYGPKASLLATRADYTYRKSERLGLLRRAYRIAMKARDSQNLTAISSSLAQIYAEDIKNTERARFWLRKLERHLRGSKDAVEAREFVRLRTLLGVRNGG